MEKEREKTSTYSDQIHEPIQAHGIQIRKTYKVQGLNWDFKKKKKKSSQKVFDQTIRAFLTFDFRDADSDSDEVDCVSPPLEMSLESSS